VKLGKINGILIKIHFSTLVIVGLVGFYSATFFTSLVPEAALLEILLVGVLSGFIILFSILFHELFHSLMAQRYGLNVSEIELYLFGGVSKIEEEPRTPKSEMIISVVGPLSSLFLGIVFLSLLFLSPGLLPVWIIATFLYSGISNIALGFFNLLPAFPMDGGRVLRAYLWNRRNNLLSATKTASRIGSLIGYSLMIYGFLQIFILGLFGGFWLIIMGSFLNSSARKSYVQTVNQVTLSNINIDDVILGQTVYIPYDILVEDAIRRYFMAYKKEYFPVIKANEIIGILHLNDVKRIPTEQRARLVVGDVSKPIEEFPIIDYRDNGKNALQKLYVEKTPPHIGVVKDQFSGEIMGFLSDNELYAAIKFCQLNPTSCQIG
jgi:Zn-dependent protease